MKRLAVLPIALGLLFPGNRPAFALSSRSVFEGDVTKGIDLKVWPGYGLTINLLPTHAIIKQAWLGHPGRFLLSSNGHLCPQSLSSQLQSCKNTGASVVFLRLIDPKTFNNPDLPPSTDGSTQVTLLVQEPNGEEQELQFGLLPAQGKPEYTSLRIQPDSEKPAPVLPLPPVRLHPVVPKITSPADNLSQVAPTFEKHLPPPSVADSAPKLPITSDHTPPPLAPKASASSIDFHPLDSEPSLSTETIKSQHQTTENATAFAFGLLAGIQSGEIQMNTPLWNQAQDTLSRLRRGESMGQALSNSKLNYSTFNYFLTLGQQASPLLDQNIKSVFLNSNTAKTPPTAPSFPQNHSETEYPSGKSEPRLVITNYFI